MGKPIKLDCWSVTAKSRDPYKAPELIGIKLQGILTENHPDNPELYMGKHVVTSRIISTEGRRITTHSGTEYLLGRIDPIYRKYLRKNKLQFDWRDPIKLIKG